MPTQAKDAAEFIQVSGVIAKLFVLKKGVLHFEGTPVQEAVSAAVSMLVQGRSLLNVETQISVDREAAHRECRRLVERYVAVSLGFHQEVENSPDSEAAKLRREQLAETVPIVELRKIELGLQSILFHDLLEGAFKRLAEYNSNPAIAKRIDDEYKGQLEDLVASYTGTR